MKKALQISLLISVVILLPNPIKATEEPAHVATATHAHDLSDIDELDDSNYKTIDDPFEKLNRAMYIMNKGVDKVLISPVTKTYHYAVSEWGRDRVSSFVQNLKEPGNMVNAIFQSDADLFANSVGRFLTNSILGLGGIFDVAGTGKSLQIQNTDFGLTLKKYGVETGPYIILPILGPSSARDAPSLVADYYIDPINYKYGGHKIHKNTRTTFRGLAAIDRRDSLSDSLKSIEDTSVDEYASIRSIYMQKR